MPGFKRTRGRQKIPMRKIENESDRFATFSKRRKGFYKKATEFCRISGSDIGIVLTSPTGKMFSFFSPSMEAITNKFFNQTLPNNGVSEGTQEAIDAQARARVDELYGTIDALESHLDALDQRSNALDVTRATQYLSSWFDFPVDTFNLDEVLKYQSYLALFQNKANAYFASLNNLNNGASTSSNFAPAYHDHNNVFYPPFAFGNAHDNRG